MTEDEGNEELRNGELQGSKHSFESLLEVVGSFGRWQMSVLFISTLSGFLCALNHLGGIFLAYTPDSYYCQGEDMELSKGRMCESSNGSHCSEWIYSQDVMKSSVVMTFDLVCQNRMYFHLIQSTYMAGIVFATVTGGLCSDHFGRRTTLLASSLLHCVLSFCTAFSPNIFLFLIVRFLLGGSAHVMWSSIFVLIMESTSVERRAFSGIYLNFAWNSGSLLMTGISYALRDWRDIQLSYASLALLSVFHLWICESPRWLIKQKRIPEADKALRRIAAFNGKSLEGTEYSTLFNEITKQKTSSEEDGKNNSSGRTFLCNPITILRHTEVRRRFLILIIPFFSIGTSSYGIHFAAKLIPFDIFLVCVYKDVMIAVIVLLAFLVFRKMYRIPYLIACFALTGVIGATFPVLSYDYLRIIVYGILQSLGVACFYFLDIYTPEAFPTSVRSQVFSILDCWSKVGASLCTLILEVGTDIHQDFPLVIFGILLILASFAFMFLPETKGTALVDDASDLNKTNNTLDQWRRRSKP